MSYEYVKLSKSLFYGYLGVGCVEGGAKNKKKHPGEGFAHGEARGEESCE